MTVIALGDGSVMELENARRLRNALDLAIHQAAPDPCLMCLGNGASLTGTCPRCDGTGREPFMGSRP